MLLVGRRAPHLIGKGLSSDAQHIGMKILKSLLEGLCARWATEHITREQLEEMEENVYLAKFHAAKGHMDSS